LEDYRDLSKQLHTISKQDSFEKFKTSFYPKLKNRIEALPNGQRLLIPGGVYHKDSLQNVLYEVKRIDNHYQLQVMTLAPALATRFERESSLDETRLTPLRTFTNLSFEQLDESMEPLLELALPQGTQTLGDWVSKTVNYF